MMEAVKHYPENDRESSFNIDSTKLVHELLGPGPTLRAMNVRVLSEVATYLDPLVVNSRQRISTYGFEISSSIS
jgi:hypothetical protein